MAEYWGLAAYAPAAAWTEDVRGRLDGPLQVTTLAELRAHGVASLVRRLRQVNADVGLVLDDGTSGPLVPALLALIALTRCRRLERLDAAGVRRQLSRFGALGAATGMVRATITGLWSAWRCSRELHALSRQPQPRVFPPSLRAIAVLRTNLWYGLKAGGSVGHFAGVVNAFARRGIRVRVLAPEPQPMVDPEVPTTSIPGPPHPAYPYELTYYTYHRRFVREAAASLAGGSCDALYHRLSLGSWAGASLASRLNRPLIVEYNGSEVWVSRHWGRRLWLERLAERGELAALRAADVITVVSEPLADELRGRGIPPERILVHPNGVDVDLFDPDRFSAADAAARRREVALPDDATVCTFVGTFGRWHGVDVLAEAVTVLAADGDWLRRHRVHFLLVGDGALMPATRAALATCSSIVTFTGLRPQHETPGWLAASDILLSPHVPNADGSRFFGSPTKLFEYMAMGRGIVASALEQLADVLQPGLRLPYKGTAATEAVALLTSPGSVTELVAGIRCLVERPDLRAQLGGNARRLAVKRYTWAANVGALLERCAALTSPSA